MPILTKELDMPRHFSYPKSDYKIVKYLDITKFISMLQRRSLFFCRVDKLEDQFEGTTSKASFDTIIKTHQRLGLLNGISCEQDELEQKVKKDLKEEERYKSLVCVNCWNKKEEESVALWKIYSDFNKGIMLKSSIRKLKESLERTNQEIYLSEIRYLDYGKQIMPYGNMLSPFIHKQLPYSYEDEIRLLNIVDPIKYDWSNSEVEEGIYIKIDLDILIDEIIISPFSPKWFAELVEDLLEKYELNKPIKKSILSLD